MDIKTIKKPLTKFKQAISRDIKTDKIIVFGSYLEGNATKDSDIDVIVVSDDFKKMNEDQRLFLLYDAADNTDPIVSPWGFTNQELQKASKLTTLGYARDHGYRFL